MAEVLARLRTGGSRMSADVGGVAVLHVRALGTTVAIDVADDALVELLERAWEAVLGDAGTGVPGCARPGPRPDGVTTVR